MAIGAVRQFEIKDVYHIIKLPNCAFNDIFRVVNASSKVFEITSLERERGIGLAKVHVVFVINNQIIFPTELRHVVLHNNLIASKPVAPRQSKGQKSVVLLSARYNYAFILTNIIKVVGVYGQLPIGREVGIIGRGHRQRQLVVFPSGKSATCKTQFGVSTTINRLRTNHATRILAHDNVLRLALNKAEKHTEQERDNKAAACFGV